MKLWYLFLIPIILLSCNFKNDRLNNVLLSAGANKIELEKVLNHYKDLKDKEKYEAACFLIENIVGMFSIEVKKSEYLPEKITNKFNINKFYSYFITYHKNVTE